MKTLRPSAPRMIRLRVDAPPMPEPGQACNGCGVCCAWAPCPLGVLVSGRRRGRCRALRWSAVSRQYRCGMVSRPAGVWPWLPRWAESVVRRLSRRWISAASGCDAALAAQPPD